jgi:hypothetical protein
MDCPDAKQRNIARGAKPAQIRQGLLGHVFRAEKLEIPGLDRRLFKRGPSGC